VTPRHKAPIGSHLGTEGAVQHNKNVPGRAGNLSLLVLPKHHGPCILSSRHQKATVTTAG